MPVLIVAVGLLGLAIGSFLNVVIYRVPAELSLVTPPSRCPGCETPIRNRHNIPVFGWLILRGRCKDCETSISPRYPLVELVTGVLYVAVALKLANLHLLAALPAFLIFTAAGVALTLIDVDVQRLPNKIVLPLYPILLLALTIAALAQHQPSGLLRAVIGLAALYAFYYVLAFAYPAGMGFGDVKLAGPIGMLLAYLSYQALVIGAFAAFLLGGLYGVAAIALAKGSRKSRIPFGPFMILGALIAIFASDTIWHAYTSLVLT